MPLFQVQIAFRQTKPKVGVIDTHDSIFARLWRLWQYTTLCLCCYVVFWRWKWFIIGNSHHNPAFNGIFSLFDSFLVSLSMCDTPWKFRDSYNKDVVSAIPLDNH